MFLTKSPLFFDLRIDWPQTVRRMMPFPRAFMLLSISYCLVAFSVEAQSIENIVLTSPDSFRTIRIRYDLVYDYSNTPMDISISYKQRGVEREFPIALAEGDVGDFVIPGENKEIIWHATEELVDFEGELSIAITYQPLLKLPEAIKRGKSVSTALHLDSAGGNYSVSIYRDGVNHGKLSDSYSPGSISIPRELKARKGYQIALEAPGHEAIFSNSFRIKRKIPLFLKILPVIVGAGVVTKLLIDKGNEPLPGAPLFDNLIKE